MSLYQQLADRLQSQIDDGIWQPGERIPSIRQSCKTHGLSPMTVLQAYQLLESQGRILARPQSGYYVKAASPQVVQHTPSQTHYSGSVDINDLVFEVLQASKSRDLVPLGMSVADPTLFPHPQLGRALASCMRKLDPFSTVADLPPGNEALRRAIAQRYASDGVAVNPQEIIITTGAMEALSLSLQVLTEPGDWVVVESPTFYGALQAIERLKLKAVEIPVIPGVGIDLDLLADALTRIPVKACWLMGNVQHPLGHTMPDSHKAQLMALLNSHGVPLVEDDVYAEVYFGRERPKPIRHWDQRGDSLLCSSFSKCLAPGFRVGWVVAGPHAERVQRLQLMSTLSTNVPSQLGLAEMLRQGGVDAHFRRLRHTLAQRQQQMRAALQRLLPDKVRISSPDGGYFLWLALPAHFDSRALHAKALGSGFSVAPGALFSSQGQHNHCLRLNSSHPWSEQLEQALFKLAELINRQIAQGT
ncbi:putative DNA-binding transcriptional regulator fused with a domain with PLP-binding motif [Aeromonas veronii]|uniref:Putative DNA-binding transcriptional regulator fused with a domain with PLP-binding motif n=1 Tax=Aeromonas veronii TaxID=654 RepID=A0A653L1L6_AERVE|nr:PLP-dependent aminotransferase family protein [Aeromonas veronii]VXA85161.1 putative DNA-binding transcriptional regulator fused with a domain with PLP-binding motif [Aeromonas veronii]